MEFIRFQKIWATPFVLNVKNLEQTIGFTLEFMRLNMRNYKKKVFAMEFMRLNFRNFKKTIDFVLESVRLNLRNSNKTIAFSLEFIGFNMRNLKKFIAFTLEFIGFKMGNVKKQVGSSLELMRFSMRNLNSMTGFTMEFIGFQINTWAKALVLEWISWDSVWKTLANHCVYVGIHETHPLVLLEWNSWGVRSLSKTIGFTLELMRLSLRNCKATLLLQWNSWDTNRKTSAKPLVLYEVGIGMKLFHFIKLQSRTTTTSNKFWIKRERGEVYQIKEARRALLIGGAGSIIRGQ